MLTCAVRHLAGDRAQWDRLRAARGSDECARELRRRGAALLPADPGRNRVALLDRDVAGAPVAAGTRWWPAPTPRPTATSGVVEKDPAIRSGPLPQEPRPSVHIGRQHADFDEAAADHCTGSRLAKVEIVEALRSLMDRVAWIEQTDPTRGRPRALVAAVARGSAARRRRLSRRAQLHRSRNRKTRGTRERWDE